MISRLLPTHKFIPHTVVKTVQDIDFDVLKNAGIQGVVFDVDNTLIPYDDRAVKPWHEELFKTLKDLGLATIMLTNNHHRDVKTFAEECGVPIIMAANKPLKRGYKKALKVLDLPASMTMMVGDQFMTDLYGASKVGMPTILVNPIKRKSEKWYTKILRKLESDMKQKVIAKHPDLRVPLEEIHRG